MREALSQWQAIRRRIIRNPNRVVLCAPISEGSLIDIQRKLKNSFVLFIGDRWTDENTFRALKPHGIGISLGKRQKSYASYYFKSGKDVARFLDRLSRLISEEDI